MTGNLQHFTTCTVLVYSKPRGSVICESATALGLFLSYFFAFSFSFAYLFLFSVHPYLVDLGKFKKKKRKKVFFANMWRGVCV